MLSGRSCLATAGDVAARSWRDLPFDVGDGLSLLVLG
jgi:hypothetical protein